MKLQSKARRPVPCNGDRHQAAKRPAAAGDRNGTALLRFPEAAHPLDEVIHTLSAGEARELDQEALTFPFDPRSQLEPFLREAEVRAGSVLPEWLRRLLNHFKRDGNADGVLLIKGFRPDPGLPPTPAESRAGVTKPTLNSELNMALVGQSLGEMVGYAQEKKGAFWQSLNPSPGQELRQTSESSAAPLTFHTEVMFHPHMPEFILLYGLRQDPERKARTIVSCVRRFYPLLPRRTQEVLFQPLFKTGIDASFGNVKELVGTGPVVSVFYGDRGDPYFRFDLDLMVGLTPAAAKALRELQGWVNATKVELTIVPGSLCVIDNRRTVHARSAFRAHYDGRDRWLERVSVVKDLSPSFLDRVSNGRIIDTDFSEYLPG